MLRTLWRLLRRRGVHLDVDSLTIVPAPSPLTVTVENGRVRGYREGGYPL
jgi:hypothetical protein